MDVTWGTAPINLLAMKLLIWVNPRYLSVMATVAGIDMGALQKLMGTIDVDTNLGIVVDLHQ